MKTIISIFFIFIYSITKGQISCDVLYIAADKSLVASYNNYTPIGFYFGGYISKNLPRPYFYPRPINFFNRVGLNLINNDRTLSIMGGTFFYIENDDVFFEPDLWLKFYPLRTILNVNRGFDFVLSVNYQKTLNPSFGISFPF